MNFPFALLSFFLGRIAQVECHKYLDNEPPSSLNSFPCVGVIVLPSPGREASSYDPLLESVFHAVESIALSKPKMFGVLAEHHWNSQPRLNDLDRMFEAILENIEIQVSEFNSRMNAGGSCVAGKLDVFVVGHYVSSFWVQDWILRWLSDCESSGYPGSSSQSCNNFKLSGLVLVSGYMEKKFYDFSIEGRPNLNLSPSFPPILSMSGELDGAVRPTRLAMSDFHRREDDVVVLLKGVNHEALLGETFVEENRKHFFGLDFLTWAKERDLNGDIVPHEARKIAAYVIADFMINQLGLLKEQYLAQPVMDPVMFEVHSYSSQLLSAIKETFKFEGSKFFGSPAQMSGMLDEGKFCPRGLCRDSSAFGLVAHKVTLSPLPASLEGSSFVGPSNFVKLSAFPPFGEFHNPYAFLEGAASIGDVVHLATWTQNFYDSSRVDEKYDLTHSPLSASSIGVKMLSRQMFLFNTSFVVDEEEVRELGRKEELRDTCKEINERMYQKALSDVPREVRERFERQGIPLEFVESSIVNAGPGFAGGKVEFIDISRAVQVRSVRFFSDVYWWDDNVPLPIDRPSWIPNPGGNHYCQLLSPARAMEWILTDGLRSKGTLATV